jgi:tRNA(Ile)-lysidine synthetase-like protein
VLEVVRETIKHHALFSPGDTIVVAVSGGPDSLALLHALRSLQGELKISLHVAHLNHRLRGAEADADAEFVAWLASEWHLPATVQARDVAALAQEQRLSLEEAARHARYGFLAEVAARVGARSIAVAHNADDQVETVLMHFLRGAGPAGLRGMKYRLDIGSWTLEVGNWKLPLGPSGSEGEIGNWKLELVRPLLDVTRAEVEAYCLENALAPRLDRSNLDTTFYRNRLRHEVLPYLEDLNPNLRQVLRRTARLLADDYDLLQEQARETYGQVAQEEQGAVVLSRDKWRALHPSLQRGTLRMAVQQLRSHLRDIDWTHVEDARRVALEGATGAAATLPGGLLLVVGYDEITLADQARARSGLPVQDAPILNVERIELHLPCQVDLPDSEWSVVVEIAADRCPEVADRWTACLDGAQGRTDLALRRRRPGDHFEPAGLGGHSQSVHKYMIDQKIPRAVRDHLPLLVSGDRILWVCGWRIDERARGTSKTTEFLTVKFTRKDRA